MWRAGSSAMTITNTAALTLNGALYAPSSRVPFAGSAVATKVTSIVAQSLSLSSTATLTIGSASPLSITGPSTLPGWTVNKPLYPNTTIIGAGGDGVAYNWSATGIPAGLALNAASGVISGKPTAAGVSSVTVTVGDSSGNTVATRVYSLTINAAPIVTTPTLPNSERTFAYSSTLANSGGTTPFTWAATGIPAGLTLNTTTGVISGTPTGSAGTATVNVTLTDAAGAADTETYSLVVLDPVTISTASPLPAGEKTIAYSTTIAATTGKTAYTWTPVSGMPAGLTLNTTTGVISGTPTGSGVSSVVVRVTDALGATDTDTFSLTINPQPTITGIVLTNGGPTAGTIEKGDTIAITFSAQMSEATMCSAWTGGDSTAQLINADSNVTVSISDGTGATNDALTVTSTSCTFNFGSLNLGSNAYVSAATSFGGTATNVSSISWTPGTRVLLITLGAKIAGTVANVSTSTPIYTANPALRDSVGAALSNSPFTMAAGKKF
jgi:Putative Ig domain